MDELKKYVIHYKVNEFMGEHVIEVCAETPAKAVAFVRNHGVGYSGMHTVYPSQIVSVVEADTTE